MCLWGFLSVFFPYSWFLDSYSYDQKRCLIWFHYSLSYRNLFCGLACDLSWQMFRMHLERMCILLLLVGVFYICSIKSTWSNVLFKASVSLLLFPVWMIFPLIKSGLKVPYYYPIIITFNFTILPFSLPSNFVSCWSFFTVYCLYQWDFFSFIIFIFHLENSL